MKLTQILFEAQDISPETMSAVEAITYHVFDGYPAKETTVAAHHLLKTYPMLQHKGTMYRYIANRDINQSSSEQEILAQLQKRPSNLVASFSATRAAIENNIVGISSLRGSIGFIVSQQGTGLDVNKTLSQFSEIAYECIDDELYSLDEHFHEQEILALVTTPTLVGFVNHTKITWK